MAEAPIGCTDADVEFILTPADGLFQGHLPDPATAAARALGIGHDRTLTMRVNCTTGVFDYHHAGGDTLLVALDNVVWTLAPEPSAAPAAAARALLAQHIAGEMHFTAAALANLRHFLTATLASAIDAYFARPAPAPIDGVMVVPAAACGHLSDMDQLLERGRAAYHATHWDAAYRALAQANAAELLEPPDVWKLATAAYLTGRDAEFASILERAHHAWLGSADLPGAARCAFWLGFALADRGEMARATGWFQRAGRLVDRAGGECVERGYLRVPEALGMLEGGDAGAAFRTAGEAVRVGERFGDADLLALALHLQGRALLEQQRTSDGLALLDESMVDVAAGVVSPIVTGLVYCSVIGACRRVHALERAQEWTAALKTWCDRQPDLVPYRGLCLVYRAEIMQLRGAWPEALQEAARVLDSEAADRGPAERAACAAAHYQQGEVHRLRGEWTAAEAAYREAGLLGREPQPGLALLRLARGDVAAARSAIQRTLAEARDAPARSRLLPAAVEIALAAGDLERARAASHELEELATTYGAAMLAALAMHTRGALALAEGNTLDALKALRRACNAWQKLAVPWEEARTRVLLARACVDLGDADAAILERDAARRLFAGLGAADALARLTTAPHATATAKTRPHDLTSREREVLALLARGLTNRALAERLSIREKTVARHVSNIFSKLGVSTRAAATAHAYENALIERGE